MNKFLTVLALGLCLGAGACAEQDTTVLSAPTKCMKATGALPYIDGSANGDFEKLANDTIVTAMRDLVKRVGGSGSFNYSVQLNRPSVVSLLLKAQNGAKTAYKALNLDLTTGRDAAISDFFVKDENLLQNVGTFESFIFTDTGVFLRNSADGRYERYVPFAKILTSVRIGDAGRLFQVARLTRNSENKMLTIPKHHLLAIQLDANPSTGYHWEMSLPENNQIMKVASSFVIPQQDKERVGTPGKEIIFLYTVEPGKYDLEFRYKRGWEKFSVDKFLTSILVVDN